MSFMRLWICVALLFLGWLSPVSASPEKVSAPDGCPTMTHVPLVTVVRGDPAVVAAKIECATGTVLDVQVYVRLLDVGKPTPISMSGKGDGTYEATLPVAMFRGISRFWYYIDARGKTTPDQAEEGVAQTRWYPVTIIDGANLEGGAAGAGGHKKLYWLLGGAALVGGAVALENHNDNGKSDPPPVVEPPPAPASNKNNDEVVEDTSEPEQPTPPVVPPCIPTGSAFTPSASACDTNSLIDVYVCVTCTNTAVEVSGSWGASVRRAMYNNEGCDVESRPLFSLPQPPGVPNVNIGQFTITVLANGQIIATLPWPDSNYRNCL